MIVVQIKSKRNVVYCSSKVESMPQAMYFGKKVAKPGDKVTIKEDGKIVKEWEEQL